MKARGGKYSIETTDVSGRSSPVAKFLIERSDRCIACGVCVSACIYKVHSRKVEDPRRMSDPVNYLCKNCFRCVQECPREALHMRLNPVFAALGNGHWTPEIIASSWNQAETGRIPVLGAGYRGRFSGPGFDSIWTDMSEIVRPTRDGIHGREYISTSVDIGGAPPFVDFSNKDFTARRQNPLEIPIPFVFLKPSFGVVGKGILRSFARAASSLGTFLILPEGDVESSMGDSLEWLVPSLARNQHRPERWFDLAGKAGLKSMKPGIVEVDCRNEPGEAARLAEEFGSSLVSVRIPLSNNALDVVLAFFDAGVRVFHLHAGDDAKTEGSESEHLLVLLRKVHLGLVERAIRDQVTLIVSGGMAAPEHVAKTIICGGDVAGIDVALLVALGCSVCMECTDGKTCPADLENIESGWGCQRIVNLIASWRNQLLEVLGAMGVREIRRLRGDTGRAIFFTELEEEAFGVRPSDAANAGDVAAAAKRTGFHFPEIDHAPFPGYFRNGVQAFKVGRSSSCISCGLCVSLCPYGVHQRPKGARETLPPYSSRCIGFGCNKNEFYCIDKCPTGSLSLQDGILSETLGDFRWTHELILSNWEQAEHGRLPSGTFESATGKSGGGFDGLSFNLSGIESDVEESDVDLSIELNRRGEGEAITIPVPFYGGGMSYGSISADIMVARARAARAFGTFMSTGEGGYPEELRPYKEHVITQIATGLFGVTEETIQRARIVEFKYAQGAKPGLGGHLLGDKNTEDVARMRQAVAGTSLFSPFPFHSVYSVEDHKKHVDWVKAINPRALVSVKVSTPTDVDMVAVGSYFAGANIVHLDGGYGGTGAAPEIAKKNIAMPVEYAIPRVHRFLEKEGIRDKVVLMASGGIRSASDIAKAIALGADGVVLGTSELVALGCVRCGNCESGRGCPRGIATTDRELSTLIHPEWGAQRIINLFSAYAAELRKIISALGLRNISELRGRTDLLMKDKT